MDKLKERKGSVFESKVNYMERHSIGPDLTIIIYCDLFRYNEDYKSIIYTLKFYLILLYSIFTLPFRFRWKFFHI